MSVGELKTMGATGREVRCTEDADKANLLADFYFSIYVTNFLCVFVTLINYGQSGIESWVRVRQA